MTIVPTIGLEVHAQLLTRTKMFCGCVATYGEAPNSRTCPVCLGLPGALPVPNRAAVEMAVKMGLACGCRIAERTKFDRKNYFYPDLPKGYQISQYDLPLCAGGGMEIRGDFGVKRIGIIRIHLEEDAGKSIHGDPDGSLVDLNRCGVPLMEIVSAPDIASTAEAYAYLMEIRRLVRWLGICDGNLEEGSLRCDANVSVARAGEPPGTPVEIKNLNSFHGVEKALQFEMERQTESLQRGEPIMRQTRLWDAARGETRVMRTKERADDYRYFPEPDLVELDVGEELQSEIAATLPELPWQHRRRLTDYFGVKAADADILTADRDITDYFEGLILYLDGGGEVIPVVVRWVTGEAMRWRKELGGGERFVVAIQPTAELIRLEAEGRVSGLAAKAIYEEMAQSERGDPEAIMREKGLEQVSDEGELESVIKKVLNENTSELGRYRQGQTKLLGFFVGQVMKVSGGTADPKRVGEMLKKMLEK